MRLRIFIPAATALLFALAACTQDELAGDNRLPEGEYPVVIRATGLSVETTPLAAPSTRSAVDGDWQGVTSVALKMGDAVKEYTVTASTDFKSATLSRENDPYYWTRRDPITVSAWWPFNNADITQMPAVKVVEDQSKLADFQKSAKDCTSLSIGTSSNISDGDTVPPEPLPESESLLSITFSSSNEYSEFAAFFAAFAVLFNDFA